MKLKQKAFQVFLHGLMVFTMAFGFVQPVHAQLGPSTGKLPTYSGVSDSIEEYLCTPDMGGAIDSILADCIGKLYRFGVAIGAIALVFFMVVAGYLYITGGEAGKQKGKSVLLGALTGMALILLSYLILNFINPELTIIKPISPPIFTNPNLPGCEEVGYDKQCNLPDNGGIYNPPPAGGPKGKQCALSGGYCAPDYLSQRGCGGSLAKGMSILCSVESTGDPTIYSRSDICTDSAGRDRRITLSDNPALPANVRGRNIPLSASWGLFQINLTFHNPGGLNCPNAFHGTYSGSSEDCSVRDQGLYERCIAAATNVDTNLRYACSLATRNGYRDWTCSAWKCGISQNASNCATKYKIRQLVRYRNPLLD